MDKWRDLIHDLAVVRASWEQHRGLWRQPYFELGYPSPWIIIWGPEVFCGGWSWVESMFLRTPTSIHYCHLCSMWPYPGGLGSYFLNLNWMQPSTRWVSVVCGGIAEGVLLQRHQLSLEEVILMIICVSEVTAVTIALATFSTKGGGPLGRLGRGLQVTLEPFSDPFPHEKEELWFSPLHLLLLAFWFILLLPLFLPRWGNLHQGSLDLSISASVLGLGPSSCSHLTLCHSFFLDHDCFPYQRCHLIQMTLSISLIHFWWLVGYRSVNAIHIWHYYWGSRRKVNSWDV